MRGEGMERPDNARGQASMSLPLTFGRRSFGSDPAAYHHARPDYPDALYARLAERCGERMGGKIFEIGAGTGMATRRLLTYHPARLVAIEPDARMAEFLRRQIPGAPLELKIAPFEEVELPAGEFDLGVAATSFHWLEQSSALQKVYRSLAPGGWWAMFWMQFGADAHLDAFQAATDHLFEGTMISPSHGTPGRPPFALDEEARMADLQAAGFTEIEAQRWGWSLTYDPARLLQLYSTFSPIQAMSPEQRATFFSGVEQIAVEEFDGAVERPFTAILYTARRP
jgi:SAM-dependent methyltransferase